jgi:hypothetical protein
MERQYGKRVADRAVEFIYTYPDLNRLFEHQYLAILDESGFSPVMVVRNRKGHAPSVPGATNTREFVWVLKKGRPNLLEKATFPLKFGMAYLSSRFLPQQQWPAGQSGVSQTR